MKKYLISILIILIIVIFIWLVFFPVNPSSEKEVIFNINRGEGSKEIALNLEKAGLVKWAPFFRIYVLTTGTAKKLQTGSYLLLSSMSISKIAEKISSGDVIKLKVTIPEGFNLVQIEEEMKVQGLDLQCKSQKLSSYINAYDFLKTYPNQASLEGYLFPDTYYFPYQISNEDIIKLMLNNFDSKLTPDLREEIKKQKKTVFEIVTAASLIEKEVRTKEDKEIVSGILWKRIDSNIPLQIDATIAYLTGKQSTKISLEETKIDSPYNTYKYRGLPVGPICNPGIESIKAAIYPKESAYWFYLSTPKGETIFSRNLDEHNIAKARYLK